MRRSPELYVTSSAPATRAISRSPDVSRPSPPARLTAACRSALNLQSLEGQASADFEAVLAKINAAATNRACLCINYQLPANFIWMQPRRKGFKEPSMSSSAKQKHIQSDMQEL